MKFTAALFAILPLLAAASDVYDLTASSFKDEVMKEDLALVEFFAPWCGHCKNLAPHYEEAATELKNKSIKLAKVDCTEQADLCQEYGIGGYPTLKVFRNGVPVDYNGPRKADGIISYMTKQSLPAVSDVTGANHDEFTKADKVVVVAYGDDAHPIPESFKKTAGSLRDSYLFGSSTDSAAFAKASGSPSLPAIVLYKKFDEGHNVYTEGDVASLSSSDLEDFIKVNSVPLLDQITPENFGSYAEQGLPLAYLFVDPADSAREALVKTLEPIAKGLKGVMNFVWIDAIKFIDHGKSLNLPGDKWPAFVIQDLAAQTKFPLAASSVVDAASIKAWADKWVTGALKPSIKSAPVPASQDEPVFKLVADNWDELFGDNSKDVFAEFMAPWCGHCQRLAPIWETLGEKYAGVKDKVVIAQMDATENDIPPQAPFKVSGFPTLKFRAAGTNEFIDYEGDRSLESLVEFVESNAKNLDGDVQARDLDEDDEEEDDEEDLSTHEHDEL